MGFDFKKVARKTLVASVVAGAVLVAVPAVGAAPASANEVGCTDANFVHLYWHDGVAGPAGRSGVSCYANRGDNQVLAVWADRITTGNNSITYTDANGSKVDINAWNDVTYNNKPQLTNIYIK
ncbi:beta/gamma crystallin domain-containing protein [Psychromicrobium sp. YIM B11713]|uniref:beta/gamma crystallin domain-containing protein n=1 Tax=Psychromicrobium sp. YIM B11713 TaxID=3145233 RepID=UPI00374E44A6